MNENDKSVKIEDYEFSTEKNGINREEVRGVLCKLLNQCNELSRELSALKGREEHLASLTRLAEKTVMDADFIARDIKSDAQKHVEELVGKAQRQAEELNRQTLTRLRETAREITQLAENLNISGSEDPTPRPVDATETEQLLASIFAGDEPAETEKLPIYKGPEKCQGEVGIEIIPPIDVNAVMGIIQHLESLPQIDKVELLSRVDKPLVIVCLKQSIDVAAALKELPAIKSVSSSKDPGQIRPTLLVNIKSTNRAAYP